MLRVAYLQTLDEVAQERIDPHIFSIEAQRTADLLNRPDLVDISREIVGEADALKLPLTRTAAMPGSVSFMNRLGGREIEVVCILLEVRTFSEENAVYLNRYRSFCQRHGILLHVLDSRWRRSLSERRAVEKASFEHHILTLLKQNSVDVVILDRAMFYLGLLISEWSPIREAVLNSHPGLLSGILRNPGRTPVAGALAIRDKVKLSRAGVTVHVCDFQVDAGEVLHEAAFDIADVQTEVHLRTRIYSGFEAFSQLQALRSRQWTPIEWDLPSLPDETTLRHLYEKIVAEPG